MNTPTPKAALYLQKWAHEYTGYQELPTAASHLLEVLDLAEQDFAACQSKSDRQAVWVVVVGALKFFAATQIDDTAVVQKLYEALVGVARGEQGNFELEPDGPRRAQRFASQEWCIACAMIALELHPDRSGQINKWLYDNAGKRVHQIRKMKDNLEQEKGPYEALRRNLGYIRAAVDAGDDWMIREILV